MKICVWFLSLLLVMLMGCRSNDSDGGRPSPPESPKANNESSAKRQATPPSRSELPATTDERPYQGPPVSVHFLQLQTHPVQYAAAVEVTAPTGGWTLELDKGEVVDGTAKVYLTLERPAKNEMVTQALVTHTKSFTTTTLFTKAEIYIHLAQRGVQTLTTDYRLAAQTTQ
jgi:hypothetical protein